MTTFAELPIGQRPHIALGLVTGRGMCLTFDGHEIEDARASATLKELINEIVSWLTYHHTESRSPLFDDVKAASHFIQSRSDSYLMIEFWSNPRQPEIVRNFVNLLRGRFEFNFDPI